MAIPGEWSSMSHQVYETDSHQPRANPEIFIIDIIDKVHQESEPFHSQRRLKMLGFSD